MTLDPRLASSSVFVCELGLCQVRLSQNGAFPWVLLIPQKNNVCEIWDLDPSEQQTLMHEIAYVSQVMRQLFNPDKMNIATLGNVVPQMHVHIIARYHSDGAWPNPVWNCGVSRDYTDLELSQALDRIRAALVGKI